MKRRSIAALVGWGLAALPGSAKADLVQPGVVGVAVYPSEEGCWLTTTSTASGIRFNSCGTGDWDFRQIYFPLTYETTWNTTWHAQIRATNWTLCAVVAFPEDASVLPWYSGWQWATGVSSPLQLDLATPGFTAAYVQCYVPHNGFVASVKWWMTP
jgi:hypothetical protein